MASVVAGSSATGAAAGVTIAGNATGAAAGVTIAGNATALTLQLTHLYTFVKPVWKAGSVGDRTAYAYVLGLWSSVALVQYGATSPPASLPSLTLSVNGVGAALHLLYIVVYLWFSAGRERKHALYLLSAAIGAMAAAAWVTVMCTRSRWGTTLVAAMALLSAASTHLVPAYDVVTAARTGRVDKINLIKAVLSVINGLIWTAWGFDSRRGINVYVVVVPSLIGVGCAAAQVVVYLMHRGSASQIHAVDDGHDRPEC